MSTTNQPQPLQPLDFPLYGARLIEASAGTGKTYTIAALYLRLVLGQGGANSYQQPLMPPQILVVTFTNAATRELRDRIRARLSEAALCFRGQQTPADPLLNDLLNLPEYQDDKARGRAAYLLDQAAQWMDDAAIFTIHSWSQRMLLQHAFDSGALFEQSLESDDSELLLQAVRDYWRTFFYPLSLNAVSVIYKQMRGPDDLLSQVRPLLQGQDAALQVLGEALPDPKSPPEMEGELVKYQADLSQVEHQLKSEWQQSQQEIIDLISEAMTHKQLNGNSFRANSLEEFLILGDWLSGDTVERKAVAKQAAKFAQTNLISKTKKNATPPAHLFFELLDRWSDLQEMQPNLMGILVHASEWIQARFAQQKLQQATLNFDDLLLHLDQALSAANGERLAQQIRTQYPVALIDEFQDTDPVQYRSFSRIYKPAFEAEVLNTRDTALLMIGDPKQAIYAFRGADIHTYLAARQAVGSNLYTLDTNYRSSEALVTSVNALFEVGEQQASGAFLFGTEEGNPVPFQPVKARGTKRQLEVNGAIPAAMQVNWQVVPDDKKALTKEDYQSFQAQSCANEIARLLNLSYAGQAGFRSGDELIPLHPSDFAILVRTGREAETVRNALAQREIASVYLSDRESVFQTQEAEDIWRWLDACAQPERSDLILAMLSTQTLRRSYAWLDQLRQDEIGWERLVETCRQWRVVWQRQGVLAMLRQLLDYFALPALLLNDLNGERSLTNILHLAELLQQAATSLDGETALVRFLAEKISAQDQVDEQILRLESDADRVQVITIHKSKGLEYPLVYLPFIGNYRAIDGKSVQFKFHEGTQQIVELDTSSETARMLADQERLQEDMRLLYVALTRPVYTCWLGLGDLAKPERSAWGALLGNIQTQLHELEKSGKCAFVQADTAVVPVQRQAVAQLADARRLDAPVQEEHWWIASYSALEYGAKMGSSSADAFAGESGAVAETAQQDAALELRTEPNSAVLGATTDVLPEIHQFQRGPAAGTFLHAMLEWSADEGFDNVAADAELREQFLAVRCKRRDWEAWQSVLNQWWLRLLETPLLPQSDLNLVQLETYQAELEFWFGVSDVKTEALDRLSRRITLAGEDRPQLSYNHLNGMLKGFIDLVFEAEGKYWVLDYKSNWLGDSHLAYDQNTMRKAVLDKRYDLQYLLYLVALHRLLKARLPDYAADPAAGYEQYVGGAIYLFLRGIDEAEQHGCFIERPSAEAIIELDQLLAGESQLPADEERH